MRAKVLRPQQRQLEYRWSILYRKPSLPKHQPRRILFHYSGSPCSRLRAGGFIAIATERDVRRKAQIFCKKCGAIADNV